MKASDRETGAEEAKARRAELLREMEELLRTRRLKADKERPRYFIPDRSNVAAYEKSLVEYRRELTQILGWPLTEDKPYQPELLESEELGERDGHRVRRIRLKIHEDPGLSCLGLLFQPLESGEHPLIIALHGGEGTIEKISGWGQSSDNYNSFVQRLCATPTHLFIPQLFLWKGTDGPAYEKDQLDSSLKQLGGSLASLEILKIRRSLDWLLAQPGTDAGKTGMLGLSYGGFYTLITSALDPRIKSVLVSGFLNDRYRYNWPDWIWMNSAFRFLDAELALMVCPRHLAVEHGRKDDIFDAKGTKKSIQAISEVYQSLGLEDRFLFRIHGGGHEFDKENASLDHFLQPLR